MWIKHTCEVNSHSKEGNERMGHGKLNWWSSTSHVGGCESPWAWKISRFNKHYSAFWFCLLPDSVYSGSPVLWAIFGLSITRYVAQAKQHKESLKISLLFLLRMDKSEILKLKAKWSVSGWLSGKGFSFSPFPLLMEIERNWLWFIMRDQSLLFPLRFAVIALSMKNSLHILFWWVYDEIP